MNPDAGRLIYQQSERTLVSPQMKVEIYHQSELTSMPVRFTRYQRSEWFGE